MIFTNDWFESQRPVHERFLNNNDKEIHILEIGSHEGRSTVFFSKYLNHIHSTLTCIDPYLTDDTTTPVDNETLNKFKHNISLTDNKDKITLIQELSFRALADLMVEDRTFDYILVDGSHLTSDVLQDAVMSFSVLKLGGIMFFDDYEGGDKSLKYPHIGINSFVKCFRDRVEILHVGYHFVVKRLS